MKIVTKFANIIKSNPFEVSGGVFVVLVAGIIVLNATVMQSGSHPAPLFGENSETAQSQINGNGGNGPLLADIWEALNATGNLNEVELPDESQIVTIIRKIQRDNDLPVTGEPSEDLLALIQTGNFTVNLDEDLIAAKMESIDAMAEIASNTSPVSTPNDNVKLVQLALARIGYGPLTVDGIMGRETSNAIQEFELDSGMPITGQPSEMLFEKLINIGALPYR